MTSCDVLVVGAGAAGLTAAVTASAFGLDVIVVEKQPEFGGTSATSGGTLWVPNSHRSDLEYPDSFAKARAYLQSEAGAHFDGDKVDAFLRSGREMMEFLERESRVRFVGGRRPDYHSADPNAGATRSIQTMEVHARILGPHLKNLRGMLPQTLFLGIGVSSAVEMKKYFSAGRSLRSLSFVLRQMSGNVLDHIVYGRNARLTRGEALVASLVRSLHDRGVPIRLSSPAVALTAADGRVTGAKVRKDGVVVEIEARCGVILATGGIPRDVERIRSLYPHLAAGQQHASLAPLGNTGDGAALAGAVGGAFDANVAHPAAWMPVSIIPGRSGPAAAFPHIVDRQKAGFIAVTRAGNRFVNEAGSYHDFVPAMVKACAGLEEACAFLIGDVRAVNRWGIGFVKPFPVPRRHHQRSGYLLSGRTLEELAEVAGIDPVALTAAVERFNEAAREGRDPDFGRGSTEFDRVMGDPDHKPNPNLAPLTRPPFFAVKLIPGEVGTFAGLRTDQFARVETGKGQPIEGLYAVGNDMASVFGGAYPGAGATLGPGMTFAYIAARHIAEAAPRQGRSTKT